MKVKCRINGNISNNIKFSQSLSGHFAWISTGNIKQLCGKMKILTFTGHFSYGYKLVTQLCLATTNISIFTRQIAYEWKYLISLLSAPDIGIKSTLDNTQSELRVFIVIGKYISCLPKTQEPLTMWCDLMSV